MKDAIPPAGVKLNTQISQATGKVSYEFANRHIDGSSTVKEYMGTQLLTAQASQRNKTVLVEIQIPAGIEYQTSTENGGLREVLTIPNFITGVERKTFGSSGENIIVNSFAPLTYTSTQTDTRLEITLSGVLAGEAQTTYKYDNRLISNISVKNISTEENKTIVTILTNKAARFSVGLSNDNSTLNIIMADKNEVQSRLPLVVLDAGHGGKDPGASGSGLKEKDVNLDIILKVGAILNQKGIKVVYTRNNDTYLELNEITNIANLCNASLFVSLHCNSNLSPDPSGTETYCYYPIDNPQLYMQKDERYNLASRLQQALVAKLGRNDRGVKQANFAVLRNSEMPSALVELAFLSNPTEGELLKQESFKAGAAQAIADAIQGYMQQYPAGK
jgi:N-acetylmuramoyl-L-alanine amidase